jgi:hypothetical protein
MSEALITDIAASVQDGDDDTALDAVIQQYITDWGLIETVAEWRIANYEDLRRWAYPSPEMMAAAENNLVLAAENNLQIIEADERFPVLPENPATTAASYPYTLEADSTTLFTISDIELPATVTVSGPQFYVYNPLDPLGDGWFKDPVIHPAEGILWEFGGTGTTQFKFAVDTDAEWWVTVSNPGTYADKRFIIYSSVAM